MRIVKFVTRNSKEILWHTVYIGVLSLVFPCVMFDFKFGLALFTIFFEALLYASIMGLFIYLIVTLLELFM